METLDIALVRELIDLLPADEREVINGLFYEQLSWRDLQKRLGVSESVIARLRHQAFDKLKMWMTDFQCQD